MEVLKSIKRKAKLTERERECPNMTSLLTSCVIHDNYQNYRKKNPRMNEPKCISTHAELYKNEDMLMRKVVLS